MRMERLATSLLLAALALVACSDGLLYDAADGVARLAIAPRFSLAGGESDAFDRADNIVIRLFAGDELRTTIQQPFAPSAAETRLSINVQMREDVETLDVELELRIGEQPLFSGSGTTIVRKGERSPLDIVPVPVVARVVCAGAPVVLTSYSDTFTLTGAALFATDDTIRSRTLQWTASGTAITIDANGVVTAREDGTSQVVCSADGLTDTRAVRVTAEVKSIVVSPTTASISVGGTFAFFATLRDGRNNVITGRRITWASSMPSVAPVDSTGRVIGMTPGTTRIDATADAVTASASLTVTSPTPQAITNPATSITSSGAVLNGTALRNGQQASVWFEWSTSPTLAPQNMTGASSIGIGTTPVQTNAQLANLQPNTTYYYRLAVGYSGGTAHGQILSFTSGALPPVVVTGGATLAGARATLNGMVNPQGAATQAWFEWGTDPTLTAAQSTSMQNMGSGTNALPYAFDIANLVSGTTYYFRAVAANSGGTMRGEIVTIGTMAPSVTTLPVTVSGTTALFAAHVNANGGSTQAWFDWGTSPSLATYTRTPLQSAGSGNVQLILFDTIANLQPSTAYYVRAGASNAAGTTLGAIVSFTTASPGLPTVNMSVPQWVPGSDVMLEFSGSVNPNGQQTTVWFEVSDSTDFSQAFPTSPISVGDGFTPVDVAGFEFLSCGVFFHVRLAAFNASGVVYSNSIYVGEFPECSGSPARIAPRPAPRRGR
jgi:hypothetical protein